MKVLCSLLPSAQAVRVLQKERKIERKRDRKKEKERKKERRKERKRMKIDKVTTTNALTDRFTGQVVPE